MNREPITVKARIVSFESFSAHADSPFLNEYAKAVNPSDGVFIVHGEFRGALDLQTELSHTLKMSKDRIIIAEMDKIYQL